jgi:hypothetical protein
MSANRWAVSRRELLRDLGLGAACLPLLHAGQARAAAPQPKLLIIAAIEGYRIPSWQPADGPLTPSLPASVAPLDKHAADLIFLHDLANPAFEGCAQCATNDYATMYYGLPARPGSGTYPEPNGPTVDQVIAQAIGTTSVRRSFHATAQSQPSLIAAPGARYCFWTGPNQPINPETDPIKTYNDLFAGAGAQTDPATMKLLAERRSILDYVGPSLERFKTRLGTEDRLLIDGHLNALREFERQLQVGIDASCSGAAPVTAPGATPGPYFNSLSSYLAIVMAVLKCGISRVVTLQLSDATGTQIDFGAFVPGIPARGTGFKTAYRNWSDLGHNPILGGVDHKRIVDEWWMAQLAELIDQMKAAPDASQGTLFDNAVVLWGNNMQDGANQASQKIPWLLAGRAGGRLKTGQCLGGRTTTSVLASLCEAMGVPNHPYGAGYPGLVG